MVITLRYFSFSVTGGGACGGLFFCSSRHGPQGNGLPCLGHLVALMASHLGLAIGQKGAGRRDGCTRPQWSGLPSRKLNFRPISRLQSSSGDAESLGIEHPPSTPTAKSREIALSF